MSDDPADDPFADLKAEFRDDLRTWIDRVDGALKRVGRAGDQSAVDEFREWAHKIAGSAGAFGFEASSEAALPIDSLGRTLVDEGRLPTDKELSELTDALAALKEAFEGETGA